MTTHQLKKAMLKSYWTRMLNHQNYIWINRISMISIAFLICLKIQKNRGLMKLSIWLINIQSEDMSNGVESIEYFPSNTRLSTSSTTLCWMIFSIFINNIRSIESYRSLGCRIGSFISLCKWLMFNCSFK